MILYRLVIISSVILYSFFNYLNLMWERRWIFTTRWLSMRNFYNFAFDSENYNPVEILCFYVLKIILQYLVIMVWTNQRSIQCSDFIFVLNKKWKCYWQTSIFFLVWLFLWYLSWLMYLQLHINNKNIIKVINTNWWLRRVE